MNVRALALLLAGLLVLVTGCSPKSDAAPVAEERPDRPLTVAVIGHVTTTDPAAATDEASTVYVLNVFQRLTMLSVGTNQIKPDAADECRFINELTYSCTLPLGMVFTNGADLTASDVKFSIERAMRLNVPGTSAQLLQSLDHIELYDSHRIDFKLKWPDNSFGFALASPAASIVDEDSYPADALWPQSSEPISSGPFFAAVQSYDALGLQRNPRYKGTLAANLNEVWIKAFSTQELYDRALATGTVDVLWRTPTNDDTARFNREVLAGAEVRRLIWNPKSPARNDPAVRAWVRDATSGLRTLDSIVPHGVPFTSPAFQTAPGVPPAGPVELTLAYDPKFAWQRDLSERLKAALEAGSQVRVRLVVDPATADLRLTNEHAWTNTTLAWLQPWLEFPLPGSEAELNAMAQRFRTAPTMDEIQDAATALQRRAAEDATVLPISQGDEYFYVRPGIELDRQYLNYLGPCFQLGLWAFKW